MTRLGELREPTPAELGLDVTIGIAATTSPDGYIVAVSDHRISYDDWFPATELGARKILALTQDKRWHLSFAGDVARFQPVVTRIVDGLRSKGEGATAQVVMKTAEDAYSQVLREEFYKSFLTQLGYGSVEEFRKEGLKDLGKENYDKLAIPLMQANLGLQLLIFGYDGHWPKILAIENPGRGTDFTLQGYAVVGSGSAIALGALRYKPLHGHGLEDMIYRVLAAKFASETASHVGKSTTLITINRDGDIGTMPSEDIKQVRKVWKRTQSESNPQDAIDAIQQSRAVRSISPDER